MLKNQFVLLVFVLALLVNLSGCARLKSDSDSHTAASPAASPATLPSPTPMQITPADLRKLRWIEGTWRGTGGGVPTFYERYKFENETTLVVETLDETLTKVTDVGRFELKDGHFGQSNGDSGSVAVALDDNSISFAPYGKPSNYFRFQRDSENSWKAVLNWTDKTGAAKERVYTMERWPATKQ